MSITDFARQRGFVTSAGAKATRLGLGMLGVAFAVALSGCTTVEGTNALSDPRTFEREVMSSTLQGLSVLPKDTPKEDITQARAPLVLPRNAGTLPTPSQSRVAQLPVDSDSVEIDASKLTQQDIERLRNARVMDMRSSSGRPLTEAETRQMAARIQAGNMGLTGTTKRPLYIPPDEYFTTVGGKDVVCLAKSGELVSINDPSCPPEVRAQKR